MRIKFKRDTSFRKQFFVPDSFAHPAKMDAQLLIWIVEKYTEAGETILDPMAGSGTAMLACTLGRHCILVELEYKFCMMMWDNWYQVQMKPQLGSTMGSCQIIQGDARQLEGLVDKIVTSPPFGSAEFNYKHGMKETTKNFRGRKVWEEHFQQQTSKDNIGNLPYGEIDKCIFSPPYAETLQGSGADAARKRISEGKYKGLRPDVWTSKGNVAGSTFGDGYSRDPNGIGNLPYGQIDKIVTSPPYEGSLQGTVEDKISSGFNSPEAIKIIQGQARGYSEAPDNIGNLKSESYLEAMLQVYSQCWKVLRDGGLMILVVKPFIRNQKLVPLQEDTKQLCRQAGFSFLEEHQRVLPSQSFWRVIYAKRFPLAPKIDCEYVLIFQKRGG